MSLPKGLIHHVTSEEEDDDDLDCVRAMLGTLETGHRRRVPLKFIVRGVRDGPKTKTQARAIASHVSGTYKRWRKVSGPQDRLCLDSSTKAILKPPVPQSTDEKEPSAPIKVEHISMSSLEIDVTIEEPRHGNGTVDDEETKAKRFASLSPSMESGVGSHILDPFTPLHERIDRKVEPHLHFYFKVVLPFARRLLKSWTWYDDLPLIQATPVLAYAVAAYASIFVSGCLGGGPLVVLPPPTEDGRRPLWAIPPWLSLHTQCVSELRAIISTGGSEQTQVAFEAVLFLFRLSVLLADGNAARMHHKALLHLAPQVGRDPDTLKTELAVLRDNIISAFVHHSATVVVSTRSRKSGRITRQFVRMDKGPDWRERDWHNREAMLTGRLLAWGAAPPSADVKDDTLPAMFRMDPDCEPFGEVQTIELCRCYQIALYLVFYLNGVQFNPSAPNVRSNLLELHKRLSGVDLVQIVSQWNRTLFNILLVGAMASRGFSERQWFIHLLADWYTELLYVDDIWELLAQFVDPFLIVTSMLEEIWYDVLLARFPKQAKGPLKLYREATIRLEDSDQGRPVNRSPNINAPPRVIDVEV